MAVYCGHIKDVANAKVDGKDAHGLACRHGESDYIIVGVSGRGVMLCVVLYSVRGNGAAAVGGGNPADGNLRGRNAVWRGGGAGLCRLVGNAGGDGNGGGGGLAAAAGVERLQGKGVRSIKGKVYGIRGGAAVGNGNLRCAVAQNKGGYGGAVVFYRPAEGGFGVGNAIWRGGDGKNGRSGA